MPIRVASSSHPCTRIPGFFSFLSMFVLTHSSHNPHPVSQVTLSEYQREAKQSQVALQRAEDRAEQKEAEVGELQRRLLGMETVTAGVLLFSTQTPGPQGAGRLTEMVSETFLF